MVKRGMKRILASRLMRGVAVGYYAQALQLLLQLVGVPILIGAWGTHDYGVWLILSAIPAYFAISDFGMNTAATNDMLANATRGDLDKVLRVYGSLRLMVLATCVTIFTLAALLLWVFGSRWLGFAEMATGGRAVPTMLVLVAYSLLSILNGNFDAGFRAADRYATGRMVAVTSVLVESLIIYSAIWLGAGLFRAAQLMLLTRLLSGVVAMVLLKRQVPWLAKVSWRWDWDELRRLAEPAMASMAIPLANALVYNGSTIVIGAALNPAVVPVYSTARTLARVAMSVLVVTVSSASVQRFTVAHASQNQRIMDRLILLNLGIIMFLLVPAAVVDMVLGRWVIGIWTHGQVHTPALVLNFLAASMACNGVWVALSNCIIAINRQSTIAYAYLVLAAAGCGVGYVMTKVMGVGGMAAVSLLVDILLAAWTVRTAARLGLVERHRLLVAARVEMAALVGALRHARRPIA